MTETPLKRPEPLNLCVIFAEDEQMIREKLAQTLRLHCREVYTATNGEEALALYDLHHPDLLISDLFMPVMDGLELCAQIRKKNAALPILIASAHSDTDFLKRAIELDVTNYLIKPINLQALRREIDKIHTAKQTALALKANQKLLDEYRHAIDESSIVSKADLQGRITYVNDKFCEISGYTREELIGKPHALVRHPETPKAVFQGLWETIKAKKIWRGRITNRKKDGDFYIVEAVITPILDSQGEIIEYISIRQDVTELVRAGRQVIEAQQREKEKEKEYFEKLNETKDSFLVVFTHELKTPLNAIINFAQSAANRIKKIESDKSAQLLEMLEAIKQNGLDMLDTVTNILDITKLKSNNMTYYQTSFALSDILTELLHKNTSLLEAQAATLEIDWSRLDTPIASDPFRVRQILGNLLSNAIKYGRGAIRIESIETENTLSLSIEDNGPGIADKQRVFELFYQEHTTDDMTRQAKGTGVGLHFVKLLCEGLGIGLALEDSPQLGGAKFNLIFNKGTV